MVAFSKLYCSKFLQLVSGRPYLEAHFSIKMKPVLTPFNVSFYSLSFLVFMLSLFRNKSDHSVRFISSCFLRSRRDIKGLRMEFSDTFQSRPLISVPPHTPCLFTEKNLRVTEKRVPPLESEEPTGSNKTKYSFLRQLL